MIAVLSCAGLMVSKTLRPSGVNDVCVNRFIQSLVLTEGGGARGGWTRLCGPRLPTDRRRLDYALLPEDYKNILERFASAQGTLKNS